MTFLPIVDRELRVAARKRSTFWIRVAAAVVGLLIAGACALLMRVGAFGSFGLGSMMFGIVTWLSFLSALAAGLFFTSDSLSEEKREGTLGFLFLTDLRGYDVVAGKLLATSLRGFYALTAVFPVLAITFFMGGVTGLQIWKTSLALLNALFFSLAAGLFVSAISRDFQRALAGTLFVLLLFCLGGALADSIIGEIRGRGFRAFWSLAGPGYPFLLASAWGRTPYWTSLIITQFIAWLLFGLASFCVPRTWQEKSRTKLSAQSAQLSTFKYGGAKRRSRLRAKLLDRNVVLWLACRERWQSVWAWILTLLGVGGFAAFLLKSPPEAWMAWTYLAGLFLIFLYLWIASQSSRFFVEAGRSGLTELLLATPVNEKQIVLGHWRALLRMFACPILIVLCLDVVGEAFSMDAWLGLGRQASRAMATPATNANAATTVSSTNSSSGSTTVVSVTVASGPSWQPMPKRSLPKFTSLLLGVGAGGLPDAANLIALCWFGMWMGHTSKNGNLAALKTILFVQVVPWLIIKFSSSMAIGVIMAAAAKSRSSSPTWMAWWPLVTTAVTALLSLGKDAAFILWSRKKLYLSFREQAVRNLGQPKAAAPPAAPPNTLLPPVIFRGGGE